MLMNALGALHGCQVALTVTAATQGHNGQLSVLVEARFELLPGSSLPRVVSITEGWPNVKSATFDALCYNAVWQLDYEISRVYEQVSLIPRA
jgi:hypothetical protein